VRAVQRAARSRVRIRIDANQGYTAEQGVAFVRDLDPESIELFEQPCAAGDWDAHLAVARAAASTLSASNRVPLMLDESIYGLADIEKAAALECAQFIKLKLMKFVTLDALAAAIDRIRALGMQVVLGNGVACDVGCLLEALVAAGRIDNAGEMNGFLKTDGALLDRPLELKGGALVLPAGYTPRVDPERIARYCVDSVHSGAIAPAPKAA
jgi:L-alanine-DL-glutamate epimerase-like enolase superfamily enzyme